MTKEGQKQLQEELAWAFQDEESRQISIDDGEKGDFEFLCEYLKDFDDYEKAKYIAKIKLINNKFSQRLLEYFETEENIVLVVITEKYSRRLRLNNVINCNPGSEKYTIDRESLYSFNRGDFKFNENIEKYLSIFAKKINIFNIMPLVFDIADNEDRILLPCTTFSDVWNYFRQYSDYNPQNSDEIDTMEDESAILTFGQFALLFPFMRLFKHKSIQRTTNDNRSHTVGTLMECSTEFIEGAGMLANGLSHIGMRSRNCTNCNRKYYAVMDMLHRVVILRSQGLHGSWFKLHLFNELQAHLACNNIVEVFEYKDPETIGYNHLPDGLFISNMEALDILAFSEPGVQKSDYNIADEVGTRISNSITKETILSVLSEHDIHPNSLGDEDTEVLTVSGEVVDAVVQDVDFNQFLDAEGRFKLGSLMISTQISESMHNLIKTHYGIKRMGNLFRMTDAMVKLFEKQNQQGLKSLYTARNDVNLIYEWAAVESNDIVPECSTCVIVSRYKVPCCHILSRSLILPADSPPGSKPTQPITIFLLPSRKQQL
ncbi:hypothetical protein C6P40_001962 [Pichia californica]|uniref:Uncharacterized protein n=1 Tax=Pichia californica TaxID=460514 RepID=A0A9P6WL48_9ASCO|nr:hypothetical protein C6P40_001962 [[Candida] californica]